MDAIFWGAIAFIACAVSVLALLANKAVREINEDAERHSQQ